MGTSQERTVVIGASSLGFSGRYSVEDNVEMEEVDWCVMTWVRVDRFCGGTLLFSGCGVGDGGGLSEEEGMADGSVLRYFPYSGNAIYFISPVNILEKFFDG